MTILKATQENIAIAAQAIRDGEIVALPTETVYGLGADATNEAGVGKIFSVKGRPRLNPLIVHVIDTDWVLDLAELTPAARELADAFWPGPMTLVLPLKPDAAIPSITIAGLATIAIRIPAHPVTRMLIEAASCPIAAPSANISGHVSPTTAEHVAADFPENVAIVLDAGSALHGVESTIIDATTKQPIILRHGSVTREQIEIVTGHADSKIYHETIRPRAPGQLISHYAPRCPVRLEASDAGPDEALIAFGPNPPQCVGPSINLSPTGNLAEAASNLFAALRSLDDIGPRSIAVMPVPNHGIGAAINDRLKRAAAPRDCHPIEKKRDRT